MNRLQMNLQLTVDRLAVPPWCLTAVGNLSRPLAFQHPLALTHPWRFISLATKNITRLARNL